MRASGLPHCAARAHGASLGLRFLMRLRAALACWRPWARHSVAMADALYHHRARLMDMTSLSRTRSGEASKAASDLPPPSLLSVRRPSTPVARMPWAASFALAAWPLSSPQPLALRLWHLRSALLGGSCGGSPMWVALAYATASPLAADAGQLRPSSSAASSLHARPDLLVMRAIRFLLTSAASLLTNPAASGWELRRRARRWRLPQNCQHRCGERPARRRFAADCGFSRGAPDEHDRRRHDDAQARNGAGSSQDRRWS